MKFRTFAVLVFALCVGLVSAACGSPTSSTTVSAVTVTGAAPVVGASAQYTAVATMGDGSTLDVTSTSTWTSSNAAIATVSPAGLVTAVAEGSATITATYSGSSGTAALAVP